MSRDNENVKGAVATPEVASRGMGGSEAFDQKVQLIERENQLLEAELRIAFLGQQLNAAAGRLMRQRDDHLALIDHLRNELERVRAQRAELALAVRRLSASPKIGEMQQPVPTIAAAKASLRPRVDSLRKLRIAAVMDEFTASAFAPSCELCSLGIEGWKQEIQHFRPHLLVVESAWRGRDGEWKGKVGHRGRELRELLEWCSEAAVPTVFWNKEDPVHFSTFLSAASLFDYVFTTDIDCIRQYKSLLEHDRVYLMPFACQPKTHNPIVTVEREPGACFAGAYYARYPERQRNFDTIVGVLEERMCVDIFDRNHGQDDPNYAFPPRYAKLVRGSLPFDEIERAYKGYCFGVNLNSVKQSQTMFARRVFDLIACNTYVVSNYSKGMRLLLGDLVISTDSSSELKRRLTDMLHDGDAGSDVNTGRHHRLLALRKVLAEHTMDRRLKYMVDKVFPGAFAEDESQVIVVATVGSPTELERSMAAFERQSWAKKSLVLILAPGFCPEEVPNRHADIRVIRHSDACRIMPAEHWPGAKVAFLHPADFHGAHYLTDMALAFSFANTDAVGKGSWFSHDGARPTLNEDGTQYQIRERLALRRSMVASQVLDGSSLWDWASQVATCDLVDVCCVSLDEFNYVADYERDSCPELDAPAIHPGLGIADVLAHAEAISGEPSNLAIESGFDGASFLALLGGEVEQGAIRLKRVGSRVSITSTLEDGRHKYLYSKKLVRIDGLVRSENLLEFHLAATPGNHMDIVWLFFNDDGERVGHSINPYGRDHVVTLPEGATQAKIGLRVLGSGSSIIEGLSLRALEHSAAVPLQMSSARVLLVTNIYPSASHLYRNGFVHRRVKGYAQLGTRVDVHVLSERSEPMAYEFEGVDVSVGGRAYLDSRLSTNSYSSILVHFLDETMWASLREALPKTRIFVWVHGAEVQPWYRRDFNYRDDAERDEAKRKSEERMSFWRSLFSEPHPNLKFVFVSQYFADEVMEDVGVKLPRWQFEVIHNFIDTDLFSYVEKRADQRFRILSIRPFASNKYANDLSVKAIHALRDKPFFKDLEVLFIGDGPLFDETLEPLSGLENVRCEKRFLSQQEIAWLHREFGIFLCPTRMDSQGVSRDEAMSSGLVPVTSGVTAVPEFVDEECGILAEGESWEQLAGGIESLVCDESRFLQLSRAAAVRVREQSGFTTTIVRELSLVAEGQRHAGHMQDP